VEEPSTASTADLSRCSVTHAYSTTSSVRTSSGGGTVRPSALEILRLITSSNRVACSTGTSIGSAPPQNLVHDVSGASKHVAKVRPVGHQASGVYKFPHPRSRATQSSAEATSRLRPQSVDLWDCVGCLRLRISYADTSRPQCFAPDRQQICSPPNLLGRLPTFARPCMEFMSEAGSP